MQLEMQLKSAVCRYKNLADDERIRVIAENEEKAWKNKQAEIKAEIEYAKEEGMQKGIQKGRLKANTIRKLKLLKIYWVCLYLLIK